VQALRGAAAIAVVLSHAARHVDKVLGTPLLIHIFQAGHAGVDLFFVISGFIILFVHRKDIGNPARLTHYIGRRFNRVMPLYWIALALTIAMTLAGGHALPPISKLIWSTTLLPSANEPLLGIAWTLQYEVVFYAAFALLIVSRSAGLTIFIAWFFCILVNSNSHALSSLPPPLCGAYGFEFFMGMAAAWLVTRHRIPGAPHIALLGLLMFVSALVLESVGVLDGFATTARFVYGPASLLLVAGTAGAESKGQLSVPAWLRSAGEASYSIYLFQFVFIGLIWQAWLKAGLARHQTAPLCFLLLVTGVIAGGILVSHLIEHPLLRLTRRRP
jgi:peptidoglycan/LPS O-acetylase OafA/YrhL